MKKIISVICVFFLLIVMFLVSIGFMGGGGSGDSESQHSGGESIVEVALQELGNSGGDKYRIWYCGIADDAPWCATFVSWCGDQLGYIESGVIPKFQSCSAGVNWFDSRNLFTYSRQFGGSSTYTPKAGDIIFFDWDGDTSILDHVGIVQFVENDYVITIEGNSGDAVAQGSYALNNPCIVGYGTPQYPAAQNNDFSGSSNAEIAWNFLKSNGFSDAAAAGVLGNLQQESGIDPLKEQYGGGPGRGICQWEIGGGRFSGLEALALSRGLTWTSLEVQLEWMLYEISGGDTTCKYIMDQNYGGLENFKKTSNIAWAVEAFEKSFERAGIPNMENRVSFAMSFYNQFAK